MTHDAVDASETDIVPVIGQRVATAGSPSGRTVVEVCAVLAFGAAIASRWRRVHAGLAPTNAIRNVRGHVVFLQRQTHPTPLMLVAADTIDRSVELRCVQTSTPSQACRTNFSFNFVAPVVLPAGTNPLKERRDISIVNKGKMNTNHNMQSSI